MPVSFAGAIAPLFTDQDIACMNRFGVSLSDFAYMSDPSGSNTHPDHANARDVYARLTGDAQPQMPLGGPFWGAEQLQLFAQWMTDGFPA